MDKELVKHCGFFSSLKENTICQIKEYFEEEHYQVDELILKKGAHNDKLFIIIAGEVEVITEYPGQQLVKLADMKQYDFFGEVSLIQEEVCTASIYAKTPTVCLTFDKNHLRLLQLGFPECAYDVEHSIAKHAATRLRNILRDLSKNLENIGEHYSNRFSLSDYKKLNNADISANVVVPSHLSIEMLANLKAFQHMSTEDVETLFSFGDFHAINTRGKLIQIGDKVNQLYCVLSGAVQLGFESDKYSAKLDVVGPGYLINVHSFFDTKAAAFDCLVRESSHLFCLTYENLLKIQACLPELFYSFAHECTKSIVSTLLVINKQILRIRCELDKAHVEICA